MYTAIYENMARRYVVHHIYIYSLGEVIVKLVAIKILSNIFISIEPVSWT